MEFALAPLVLALAQAGLMAAPGVAQAGVHVPDLHRFAWGREQSTGVYLAQMTYPPGYGPKVDSPTPQGDTSGKGAEPPKSGTSPTDAGSRRRPPPTGTSGTGR